MDLVLCYLLVRNKPVTLNDLAQEVQKMGEANNSHSIADYLAQLLKDKKQIAAFPNVFIHMERLLDEGKSKEILSTLHSLFGFGLSFETLKGVMP